MIVAALVSAYLGAALPAAVEPVRHRRYIIVARAREKAPEMPVAVLRTGPDPDAVDYGPKASFDARWRALQGY